MTAGNSMTKSKRRRSRTPRAEAYSRMQTSESLRTIFHALPSETGESDEHYQGVCTVYMAPSHSQQIVRKSDAVQVAGEGRSTPRITTRKEASRRTIIWWSAREGNMEGGVTHEEVSVKSALTRRKRNKAHNNRMKRRYRSMNEQQGYA